MQITVHWYAKKMLIAQLANRAKDQYRAFLKF